VLATDVIAGVRERRWQSGILINDGTHELKVKVARLLCKNCSREEMPRAGFVVNSVAGVMLTCADPIKP